MKRGAPTLCALLLAASVAACAGDSAESTPAATVGTAPKTTTTLSVEAEVEAAYLRSWDVFAKAALELDSSQLDELYSGPALDVVVGNVERLKRNNTPARFEVEHDYTIEVDERTNLAQVTDNYVNHGVLLDPDTLEPTEPDPNERLSETYLMQRIAGVWKVIDISRA